MKRRYFAMLEPPELERAARLLEGGLTVSARRARLMLGLAPQGAPAAATAVPLEDGSETIARAALSPPREEARRLTS